MSSSNLWRYLINTFNVNTVGSHVKMLSLSTDTHAKLKAEESNPLIAEILLIFEAVFFAYRDIGQQYDFRVGDYRGATLGFENIIDSVPQVIRVWECVPPNPHLPTFNHLLLHCLIQHHPIEAEFGNYF